MRRLFGLCGVLVILSLGACHTFQGMGKDIEAGGQKINQAAGGNDS